VKSYSVNVRTETTFRGFSLFQPQLNGEVGNGQDKYLMPYVLWSKLMWDWQSKSHLHKGLSVSVGGFSSRLGSFGGWPLFLLLSSCFTHLGDQGSGSLLRILCEVGVCMLLSS
jgi:hypothetical protein